MQPFYLSLQLNLRMKRFKNRCDERLNALVIRLKEFEIPASLHLALAKHCEEAGDFANAEEHLYEGLADADKKGEILQEFYERLLELPDQDLKIGDLPRGRNPGRDRRAGW